jgi:hypothetical protein
VADAGVPMSAVKQSVPADAKAITRPCLIKEA